jgi:hypothetical protein
MRPALVAYLVRITPRYRAATAGPMKRSRRQEAAKGSAALSGASRGGGGGVVLGGLGSLSQHWAVVVLVLAGQQNWPTS